MRLFLMGSGENKGCMGWDRPALRGGGMGSRYPVTGTGRRVRRDRNRALMETEGSDMGKEEAGGGQTLGVNICSRER
jgi:hypothetical protein